MESVPEPTVVHVDTDDAISLAAVGLWHRIRRVHGPTCEQVNVLTMMSDRHRFGPAAAADENLPMLIDELMANGYIDYDINNDFRLWETVELEAEQA